MPLDWEVVLGPSAKNVDLAALRDVFVREDLMEDETLAALKENELSPLLSQIPLTLGQRKKIWLAIKKLKGDTINKPKSVVTYLPSASGDGVNRELELYSSDGDDSSLDSDDSAKESRKKRKSLREANTGSSQEHHDLAVSRPPTCDISQSSSSNNLCGNCKVRNKYGFAVDPQPERWKTVVAFLYGLFVSWLSAFVMVIVHDRVPDMEKYPPLPDIILDNVPHIPWAFEMCENLGIFLLVIWGIVCFFHRHRFILIRRFFSISGTIFLLRCVTMLITSLSVPGKHLDCSPRPYGDFWSKLYNAYLIWSGAGMTLQGVRTCGDYMFSGHTVSVTLLNFFITEYTSRKTYFLHTLTWIINVFGIFFILAAHEHYSIDVFIAFYISSRLFLYYHTLANNKGPGKIGQRAWFYFPLFYFFEANVDGKIPNVFEWPISFSDIYKFYNRTLDGFSSKETGSKSTKAQLSKRSEDVKQKLN